MREREEEPESGPRKHGRGRKSVSVGWSISVSCVRKQNSNWSPRKKTWCWDERRRSTEMGGATMDSVASLLGELEGTNKLVTLGKRDNNLIWLDVVLGRPGAEGSGEKVSARKLQCKHGVMRSMQILIRIMRRKQTGLTSQHTGGTNRMTDGRQPWWRRRSRYCSAYYRFEVFAEVGFEESWTDSISSTTGAWTGALGSRVSGKLTTGVDGLLATEGGATSWACESQREGTNSGRSLEALWW